MPSCCRPVKFVSAAVALPPKPSSKSTELTFFLPANTEQVKAVTAELQKNYYSKPESLLLLIELALTHDDASIRQIASVQAGRQSSKHWKKVPGEQKSMARKHLVEGTLNETVKANRHSLARLIADLVAQDMEAAEGQDFLKQIIPLNSSDNVVAREVGSFLVYAMLESSPEHFVEHIPQLLDLFRPRIEDPESKEVRMNVVQAIGALIPVIDADEDEQAVKAIQSFIPSMVNILKATVEANDEENYALIFEVFQNFIAYDAAFLAVHLRDLVQVMMQLAGNQDAEDDARSQALMFLIEVASFRRLKIQAMNDVASQMMIGAMHIITELDPEDDEDDTSPARSAIGLVDQLATNLPPKQVIVPLLEQFPKFASHQDPRFRMSAMLSLGNAAAGAPEFISTQIEPLLPTIVSLICDPELRVRHAALIGLIHLAEEMADEMVSQHEQIISAILKNLESAIQGGNDKKNTVIIRCACGALDTFGDGIDTKIMAQYGPNLMEPMIKLLQHEDYGVKAGAASALGAIAGSMEEGFKPYFEGVMKSLAQFVMLKESEEAMNLRSATCDSLGRIALAVGAETFQPYVIDLMKASEEALGLENPRLKETTFILWSSLSKVYKEQFEMFLDGVFNGLFSSLELEEEEIELPGVDASQLGPDGSIVVGGRRIKIKAPSTAEDHTIATGGEEDEDAWADLDDLDSFNAMTAVALENEIALDVLGDVISNSCNSSNLEKYTEQTIDKVCTFVEHDYEGCRKSAISTLWRIYTRVFQVWEESSGTKWTPGLPPKQGPPPSIVSIAQTLYQNTMPIWMEDSDRYVLFSHLAIPPPQKRTCKMMNTSRYTQLTQTQKCGC